MSAITVVRNRIVTPKGHGMGWNAQRPDWRDYTFKPTVTRQDVQEAEHALAVDNIPTLDQGQQGSCTGHGPSGLVMFDQQAQGLPIVVPSRAMIYFDARLPEGTTDQDSGAQVRDAVAGIAKYGVVPDSEFPYTDTVYNESPTPQQYVDAKNQEALVYEAVRFPNISSAIASGFPVVCGATVYESWESDEVAATGVIPVPKKGEQVLGGHCFWIHGFNNAFKPTGNNRFPPRTKACRNSWGQGWGDHGNFYLPQWYFSTGNVTDLWVIRRIGAAAS